MKDLLLAHLKKSLINTWLCLCPSQDFNYSCFVYETVILGELSPNLLSHGNWKSIKFSNGDGRLFGWDPSQEVHSDTFNHFHSLSWVRPSLSLMIQTSRPYSFLYVLIQSPNSWTYFLNGIISPWIIYNYRIFHIEKKMFIWEIPQNEKLVNIKRSPFFDWHEEASKRNLNSKIISLRDSLAKEKETCETLKTFF